MKRNKEERQKFEYKDMEKYRSKEYKDRNLNIKGRKKPNLKDLIENE